MSYDCETCDRCSEDDDDDDWHEYDRCERTFASWKACTQHMNTVAHWFTDKCETCSRRFVNKFAAEQHMDVLGHRSSQYCSGCDRYFQNPSGLFQHTSSAVHLRADPIHAAPTPPTPRPPPAPVAAYVSTLAATARSSTLLATNSSAAPRCPPFVNTVPAPPATPSRVVPPAPTITPRQSTNPVSSNARPRNTGTRSTPFSVVVEWDLASSTTIHYQSITFTQPYLAHSFEELKLVDYTDGCTPPNTNRRTAAFGLSTALGAGINSGADSFQPARSSDLAATAAAVSSTASVPSLLEALTRTDQRRPTYPLQGLPSFYRPILLEPPRLMSRPPAAKTHTASPLV
ncbi:unnamed protein product [Aureobasidium vineae]|uniref:C2H2-type domain-containing protein n=1 Tax=Aureobasidium vineae TaxID=2773715 RepID=A0A9N8P4K9_9PEZI|nr:unnamed protein product [Aureobasidium vineae]